MMILKAAKFSRLAHAGQKRKYNRRDYVTHPARVAGMVALHPDATSSWVAAAYLHDVLEDTDIDANKLARSFPSTVVSIVSELTNMEQGNRAERMRQSNARLARASRAAKIIKLLDREDNLLDIPPEEGFLQVYAEETKALVEAIGHVDKEISTRLLSIVENIESTWRRENTWSI